MCTWGVYHNIYALTMHVDRVVLELYSANFYGVQWVRVNRRTVILRANRRRSNYSDCENRRELRLVALERAFLKVQENTKDSSLRACYSWFKITLLTVKNTAWILSILSSFLKNKLCNTLLILHRDQWKKHNMKAKRMYFLVGYGQFFNVPAYLLYLPRRFTLWFVLFLANLRVNRRSKYFQIELLYNILCVDFVCLSTEKNTKLADAAIAAESVVALVENCDISVEHINNMERRILDHSYLRQSYSTFSWRLQKC